MLFIFTFNHLYFCSSLLIVKVNCLSFSRFMSLQTLMTSRIFLILFMMLQELSSRRYFGLHFGNQTISCNFKNFWSNICIRMQILFILVDINDENLAKPFLTLFGLEESTNTVVGLQVNDLLRLFY